MNLQYPDTIGISGITLYMLSWRFEIFIKKVLI